MTGFFRGDAAINSDRGDAAIVTGFCSPIIAAPGGNSNPEYLLRSFPKFLELLEVFANLLEVKVKVLRSGAMHRWIDGSKDPWIHGSIDPWMHGSMDPWIDGSMHPWSLSEFFSR